MTAQLDWRSRLSRFVAGESPLTIWPGHQPGPDVLDPIREDVRAALADTEHWRDLFELASITRLFSCGSNASLPRPVLPFRQAMCYRVSQTFNIDEMAMRAPARGFKRDR